MTTSKSSTSLNSSIEENNNSSVHDNSTSNDISYSSQQVSNIRNSFESSTSTNTKTLVNNSSNNNNNNNKSSNQQIDYNSVLSDAFFWIAKKQRELENLIYKTDLEHIQRELRKIAEIANEMNNFNSKLEDIERLRVSSITDDFQIDLKKLFFNLNLFRISMNQ
jgi:hypothetical protein